MNRKFVTPYMMAIGMLTMTEPSICESLASEKKPKPTNEYIPYPPDEHLARKGLQRFFINGEEIIAHNEREAQKRYKHRHRQ